MPAAPAATPRASAIAALHRQAEELLESGDLAGARAVHEAIGRLLGTDDPTPSGGRVVSLDAARKRT